MVLIGLWACGQPWCAPARAKDAPASRPAVTEESIAAAIEQLGHRGWRDREQASEYLWRAGLAAESALRMALDHSDPEIAARAQEVLAKFARGELADTPPEVVVWIKAYRTGSSSGKRAAIQALVKLGEPGWQAAVALLANDPYARANSNLDSMVADAAGKLIGPMLVAGRNGQAERLLEAAARSGNSPAIRDYAAYCLVRGSLDKTIARYNAEPVRARSAGVVLVYLLRAKGDLQAASVAASRRGLTTLERSLQYERGDWEALRTYYATLRAGGNVEALGFLAAYERLVGKEADCGATLAAIRAGAAGQPDGSIGAWQAGEAFLLNDRPDEGVAIWRTCGSQRAASDVLAARDRYEEARNVLAEKPSFWHTIHRAQILCGMGHRARAQQELAPAAEKLLEEIAALRRDATGEQAFPPKFRELTSLMRTQREGGLAKEGRQTFAKAWEVARTEDQKRELVAEAYKNRPAGAVAWRVVRLGRDPMTPVAALQRVDEIMAGQVTKAWLDRWVRDAAQRARALAEPSAMVVDVNRVREELGALVDLCIQRGQLDQAIQCQSERIALAPKAREPRRTPEAIRRADRRRLGDLAGMKGDWPEAVKCYRDAWGQGQGDVAALWLAGWAAERAGDATRGRADRRQARLLALADEEARYELSLLMQARGLNEQAREETVRLVRTAEWRSTVLGRCLRGRADVLAGENVSEVDLLERGRLPCLAADRSYLQARYYVQIAATVALARARRSLGQGRADEAVALAREAHALCPSTLDPAIELIGALTKADKPAHAGAVFQLYWLGRKALADKYPDSAGLNNQAAWLAARCSRELGAALKYSERAVRLAPRNWGFIDTLAEVHFARGNRAKAVELMTQCHLAMPEHVWFRQQLRRFRAPRPATRPARGPKAPAGKQAKAEK